MRDTDTEIIELETLLETEFSFQQLRILIECIVTETKLRDEDCPHLVLTEEREETHLICSKNKVRHLFSVQPFY